MVGQQRSTQRYRAPAQTPDDPDRGLREWLRAYAARHPRWGYRRAHHDARAEGWVVNHKKVQRLRRQEGLTVRVRRRRKRAGVSTRESVPAADTPNVVWAIDFQIDSTTNRRPIKILSAVDEHTRECLGGWWSGRSPPTGWPPSSTAS